MSYYPDGFDELELRTERLGRSDLFKKIAKERDEAERGYMAVEIKNRIIKVEENLKYLVIAYDDKLNVIDVTPTESLKEAENFKQTYFKKFKAKSVDIARLKESWTRVD
jgi:hypothetical protein